MPSGSTSSSYGRAGLRSFGPFSPLPGFSAFSPFAALSAFSAGWAWAFSPFLWRWSAFSGFTSRRGARDGFPAAARAASSFTRFADFTTRSRSLPLTGVFALAAGFLGAFFLPFVLMSLSSSGGARLLGVLCVTAPGPASPL